MLRYSTGIGCVYLSPFSFIGGVNLLSTLDVFGDMPGMFVEALAGLFFLILVGKFTHNESRVTMSAIAGCLAYPHPATLFAVGMLALIFRAFDFINIVRGD